MPGICKCKKSCCAEPDLSVVVEHLSIRIDELETAIAAILGATEDEDILEIINALDY